MQPAQREWQTSPKKCLILYRLLPTFKQYRAGFKLYLDGRAINVLEFSPDGIDQASKLCAERRPEKAWLMQGTTDLVKREDLEQWVLDQLESGRAKRIV